MIWWSFSLPLHIAHAMVFLETHFFGRRTGSSRTPTCQELHGRCSTSRCTWVRDKKSWKSLSLRSLKQWQPTAIGRSKETTRKDVYYSYWLWYAIFNQYLFNFIEWCQKGFAMNLGRCVFETVKLSGSQSEWRYCASLSFVGVGDSLA